MNARVSDPAASPAVTPSTHAGELLADTDVLIVGGGIVGCSLANYLARADVEVVLIERDDVNMHASGRNAGSLHVQMQSAQHKMTEPAWIEAFNQSLPLHPEAIKAWQEIANEADCDIEMKICGGLMVAEDASQVAFLRSKMEREIKGGIEVHLIERAELRKMAPYFSDRVIAAEYCPLEGKLNPTYATPAIARAAERHGARIFRHTELLGFERDQGQFRVRTNRGLVRCRRLVNAAGPWGDIVAGMAGVSFTTTKNAIHMNATEAVEPFIPHLIEHAGRRLTMKQAINGNVLIGGGWPAEIDETTDRTWVARKSIEGSLWVAGAVVPRVGNLRLLRTWTGINVIMDGRPILGEVPGKPGFINALTSTGYTLGPISARLVAEQMTRKNLTMDIRPYSIERYSTAQTTA